MVENNLTYIIVLNYNAYKDTIDCLESIVSLKSKYYKIVLIDNASTDFSIDKINKWAVDNNYNGIEIFKSKNNNGYSSGNNLGIRYALKQDDCKYIWILNNDTIVDSHSLNHLVNKSDKKTIFGSKILSNNRIESLGGKINPLFLTTTHNLSGYKDDDNNKEINIDYIHGVSIFMNADIVRSVGYLSEEYFLYYEDVDYSIRALNKGFKLDINQDSIISHNSNYNKYENSTASILRKVFPVVNRYRLAKNFFIKIKFFVLLGVIVAIIKRIFTFRFKESIMIIKYLYKI